MKFLAPLFLFLMISSCNNTDYSFGVMDLDYEYTIKEYYGSLSGTLIQTEYFDKNDRLIRFSDAKKLKRGIEWMQGVIDYKYDRSGLLIEEWDRTKRVRKVMHYDARGNLIGSVTKSQDTVKIDSSQFVQSRFYDDNNLLIRELHVAQMDMFGEYVPENWTHYTYKEKHFETETYILGSDTTWSGKYTYDSKGKLLKKERIGGSGRGMALNVSYSYDDLDRTTIERTEYIHVINAFPFGDDIEKTQLATHTIATEYNDSVGEEKSTISNSVGGEEFVLIRKKELRK